MTTTGKERSGYTESLDSDFRLKKTAEKLNLKDLDELKEAMSLFKTDRKQFEEKFAKDICKKMIEEDKENIDAYYDLALIYSIEEDPYESIINLNEVIELIASGNDPPAKEDWLTANYLDISGETSLAEIHLKRGEQWNKLEKIERACKDFQKACDLGDCEMFNTHCK